MKIYSFLGILFSLAFALTGCASASPVPQLTVSPNLTYTPKPLATETLTPTPTSALANMAHQEPTNPTIDANGNVTWHPQKKLISWEESPNDGNEIQVSPNFILYWDGTLIKPSFFYDENMETVLKLNPDETCKVLNTVERSGFFDETDEYRFPFMGAWGSYIGVNAWKSNITGSQMLLSAISGASYYNQGFCSDCPIPTESTIIKPGLANIYYFLQNYRPQNAQKVPANAVSVQISLSDEENYTEWPLKSISFEQFLQVCKEDETCKTGGKTFNGEIAQEIVKNLWGNRTFKSEFFDGYPKGISISYELTAPDVPADATLTCNTKVGHYPILPLSHQNKFWYYAPDGKWGAERVEGENKMRVVNTSGYEKFYGYDPAFFGQTSIQIYPRYWSQDGQFFYVNILPGDFKPNVSLINSIGLQQIDVINEKIKYLFLGTKGETFAYEFSSDGKKMAYIRQGDKPLELVVVDTYSGEQKSVSLTTAEGTPYTAAGSLVWTYDGDKIFLAVTYEENGKQKGRILVTNTNNLADLQLVYQADQPIKLQQMGIGDSSAYICSMETDPDESCRIYLDLETNAIQGFSK